MQIIRDRMQLYPKLGRIADPLLPEAPPPGTKLIDADNRIFYTTLPVEDMYIFRGMVFDCQRGVVTVASNMKFPVRCYDREPPEV